MGGEWSRYCTRGMYVDYIGIVAGSTTLLSTSKNPHRSSLREFVGAFLGDMSGLFARF